MAVNTRIQFRRGSTNDWASSVTGIGQGILYQGELGFETTTGKFKIGNGTSHWNALPYAGGSQLIAQTGIGFTLDSQNNAYALYSVITGAAGGQDGITFQTLPLSGLLNDVNASGSYYRIALSTKLENFHDSNIDISSNLISSSTSGITISGFNFSTIDLNPSGGPVRASGIDIRNLTESITVTSGIGGLSTGTTLSTASGITAILKKMLEQTLEPTVGTAGGTVSVSLSPSIAQEVGTVISTLTISASFSQGTILGTGLGANWNSTAVQGVRYGSPTNYTIDGVDRDLNSSYNKSNHTVTQGTNSFSATVDYGTGIVPKNSLGQNSTLLTQQPAANATNSNSFTGFRGLFYGWTKTSNSIPSTSQEIRNLHEVSPTSNASGTRVNPTSRPYTITALSTPSGTRKIIVAVPSGYNSFSSGISVVNQSNFTETYSTTVINVSGANGATAIPYFVHYYIPAGPLGSDGTHTITLT